MTEESFLKRLAASIVTAGGAGAAETETAFRLAREAWEALRRAGDEQAYPCLVEIDEVRFVYAWDLEPPEVVVMLWDGAMWRDMARVTVPPGQ